MQSNRPLFTLRNVHLLPFLAVACFGLFILIGWWNGQIAWVQPRLGDAPLVANVALLFFLIGTAAVLITLGLRRTGCGLALGAALLAWVPVGELLTGLKFPVENLLVIHENLIAGTAVGRMPLCLALVLAIAATLLVRTTWQPKPRRLPLLLALTGSLACAYGATALLSGQVGLDGIELWHLHARLAPHTALALFVLGCALFLLAAPKPEGSGERPAGPRWLWLPAVVAGFTVSLLFWVSLKARENTHQNQTTQLTMNHIATLYSNEVETQVDNLRGMATRWEDLSGMDEALREKDARAQFESFPPYQLLSRVDRSSHTTWFWPGKGNEDAAAFDHAADPVRHRAMTAARESLGYGVAGPLPSPLRPPSFAIYTPMLAQGVFDGFIVGQIDYGRLLELIDRRLNISQRYRLEASAALDGSRPGDAPLALYASAPSGDDTEDKLRQSASFQLFNQRLTLHLTPRTLFTRADRNSLPSLALFSGLGVSILIGLVINLAQTARARLRAAERTADELFAENEERRRVEAALRSSQASARLLTHVAESTENIVFITTPTGLIQWANDSFTRFTGHSLADVTNTPLLELVSNPEATPQALDQLSGALQAHTPLTTEVIIHNQDHGRSCHLRFELQPVKNDEGLTENFIAMGTDITGSVQTEATLRRAKAEADAASRAKSEFLATVSHEIRTPMNGVIGMTSLLLDTPLNHEQKEFVGTIRTSGQALLGIINEILDFSKMESGHMEIEHQPVEVAQCVEEAMHIFVLQAAGKKIEIACQIDPAVPPWILLDMTRLRQVLLNLINNAVKFTTQGQITIEVRPAAGHRGNRAAPTSPAGAAPLLIDFFVRDTGIGIAPEHRSRLFKPFSQVDSSNTRKYGGTGLGLAICDRLCQLMGGTIEMQENPGGGSVFRFSVLAQPTASPGMGAVPSLPSAFHRAKVLVVDDLPLNRLTLRQTLAPLQLDTVEAGHIEEARRLASEQTFAIAIIDHDVAGESGQSFAAELRADSPGLVILFLTNPLDSSHGSPADDRLFYRVAKPIRPALIIETLQRALVPSAPAPVDAPVAAATTAVAPVATATLASAIPLRVLIVEDNPVNQKVALRFLTRLGYEATLAGNGRLALQILDEQAYDLVLMDMMMPEMDGLTATKEIRLRYPAHRQPRIFALTANAVTGDRERCLEAGMDDYLSKPVKLENIETLIRKYFPFPGPA